MLGFVTTVEKQLLFVVVGLFCLVLFSLEFPLSLQNIQKEQTPAPLCSPSKALTTGYGEVFWATGFIINGVQECL